MSTSEVVIVGGGLIGSLCALRLADAGATVTVLERAVAGAEASSAAAGILAGQSEERVAGARFELAVESRERYVSLAQELRDRVGADIGYRRCGVIDLAESDEALDALEGEFAWQRALGHRVERLSRRALRERERSVGERFAGAIVFEDDGQVDPPRLVAAVAQAAERAGAVFRSGAYVRRVVVESGRVTGVQLDDVLIATDRVVLAAGAWSSLVEGTSLPASAVRPARGQIVELALRTPPSQSVLFGRGGYVVPRSDGRVLCGSTLEFVGFQNEVTADGVVSILSMATALCPSLGRARFSRAWANFRPHPAEGVALVGDAGIDGLTLATGHSRSGILLAPATAERVRAHVLGAAG